MANINFPEEFIPYIQKDGFATQNTSGVKELMMDSGKAQRYLVNRKPLKMTTFKFWFPVDVYRRWIDFYENTLQRVHSFNMNLPTKGTVEGFISGDVNDRPLNPQATYFEVPVRIRWVFPEGSSGIPGAVTQYNNTLDFAFAAGLGVFRYIQVGD